MCRLVKQGIQNVQSFQERQPIVGPAQLKDFLVQYVVHLNMDIQRQLKSYEATCDEYILRLRDLQNLLVLANTIFEICDQKNQAELALLRIENLYFLHEKTVRHVYNQSIEGLFSQVLNSASDLKVRIRVLLYQVYNMALHDQF